MRCAAWNRAVSAPKREPAFVLSASDPVAPSLLEIWAATCFYAGMSEQKIEQVHELVRQMRAYQKAKGIQEVHAMPQYINEYKRRRENRD